MPTPYERQQELEAEEKTRKLKMGSEAKRLLREPLLDGFFKEQEAAYFEALKRLEFGTKLEEYQTIHFGLKAVMELKLKLEAFVQEAAIVSAQDDRDAPEEI